MIYNDMIFVENKIINSDRIEYAQIYFEELKTYLNSIYKYPQGNCHNLVHFGSMVLNQYNISYKKIWIFAPSRIHEKSKQSIQLPDPNGISLNGELSWGYHVALLVNYVNVSYIFDYFIDDTKPLYLNEWLQKINLTNFHLEFTSPSQYLFHVNPSKTKKNGLFNGDFFLYEGLCRDADWIPKGLAINETAIEFYKNEIYNLESTTPLCKEYKLLVGSVNNFECVLRDKAFNKKMTIDFQEKHEDVIIKYRLIYEQNLEKWINELSRFS